MIVFPNAKINLGLQITGKRKDGYHNIDSIFYPIPLLDALEIVTVDSNQSIQFSSSGLTIPGTTENNLCIKAHQLLSKQYDLPPMKIHLHKVIPMGAGLGGGSADGSFTLSLINSLCDLGLQQNELEEFALKLGSDCPFFIENSPKHVTGRGEEMLPVSTDLSGKWMLLVFPELHISTAEAYAHVHISKSEMSTKDMAQRPPNEWKNLLENGFEKSAFSIHPDLALVKERIYKIGASYASMTGSGSTMFGIFEEPIALPEELGLPCKLIQL